MSINKYVLVPYAKYQSLIGRKGLQTNSDCLVTQENSIQQGAGVKDINSDKKDKVTLSNSPPPGLPEGTYNEEALTESDSDSIDYINSWKDNWITQ